MRILQLCKKFPFPLKDGESIAVTALSRAMQELGHEVHLLAMNTLKHYYPLQELPAALKHYEDVRAVEVDNRIKPLDAIRHLGRRGSYHISRFISSGFEAQLVDKLRSQPFDVVQLETPYLAPYIPAIRKHSKAAIGMRAHNVEFEIWERIISHTRFWPKRWYLRHLTQRLRQYEIRQLREYDHLAAITRRDLDRFRQLGFAGPATVTPIGVDSRFYQPDYRSYSRPLSLSFIGSLDWMPNVEGLQWLLDRVWPIVQSRHPKLQLHIAGRNTPSWLLRLNRPGIVVEGEVPDASDFINQHSLMVVPLLSGSGMRAKILEGMVLGKAVLSTTVGMEGIGAAHRQEALIADSPEAFAAQIGYALEQQEKGALKALGCKARAFVLDRYDSRETARRLLQSYAELSVEAL